MCSLPGVGACSGRIGLPCSALTRFFRKLCSSTPPATDWRFGFRWVAGVGVPDPLFQFDAQSPPAGGGIYVVFHANLLDEELDDPFARHVEAGQAGPGGPVFTAPGAPSQAMMRLRDHPPPELEETFANATLQRLCDMTGYLQYVSDRLEQINVTPAGGELLTAIDHGGHAVCIMPGRGNQTHTDTAGHYMNALASSLLGYRSGHPLPGATIRDMVLGTYAAQTPIASFDLFAAALNACPLYTLFEPEGDFQANFLGNHFRYNDALLHQVQPITGQVLMDWLGAGRADFDNEVRSVGNAQNEVVPGDFLLLAIDILLYAASPAGTGSPANVSFNVRNLDDNVVGQPGFRPPGVGLAHELMHAMHYSQGTAPGKDYGGITTTAAELLFCGIIPFDQTAISENMVRQAWPAPCARRTIYEAPTAGETPAQLRQQNHCI